MQFPSISLFLQRTLKSYAYELNREFAEPPKPGFFRKYGWYIVPIGFVLWGLAPHIKPVVVNALENLIIMNKPESPEGDDVVASDDSLPVIVTFDEPSEPVEQKERSTLEILEEQNHKRIVEQGRRAGVSTEGSDIEILERIKHKRIVEQAKLAGVSTEGTDIEILERISRKNLEKYN